MLIFQFIQFFNGLNKQKKQQNCQYLSSHLSINNCQLMQNQITFHNPRYDQDCIPKSCQCIQLCFQFASITNKSIQQYETQHVVQNDMTIKQLKNKWYDLCNWESISKKYQVDRYIILYGVEQLVSGSYNILFKPKHIFLDHHTIQFVKDKIGVQKLTSKHIFRVYFEMESPFHQDEATFNFADYQNKNMKEIEIPFCVKYPNTNEKYYFYLKTTLAVTVKQLKELLNMKFKGNDTQLFYNPDDEYQLIIRRDYFSQEKIKKIYQSFKKRNINFDKNLDSPINITLLDQLNIRQVCPVGQTIQIFFYPEGNVKRKPIKIKYNPTIKIICYSRTQLKNKKIQINRTKLNYQKVITVKYAQIRNLYVWTLLQQHRIQDAYFTGIIYNGHTIHPVQQFNTIQYLIEYQNKPEIIFVTIPQSLLYYKTLIGLQNNVNNKSLNDLIERLKKESLRKAFTQVQRQQCQVRRQNVIKKHQNNNNIEKNFVDPIILYTSPFIFQDLNNFLKQSSLCLMTLHEILNKDWHYPFCEKFVKSLLKINNYVGTTFRGTSTRGYQYKQGDIVEYGTFMSTSKDQNQAKKFIKNKNPCFLIIQTRSGKDITDFSFFEKEKQILIMPYTKFKITKVTKEIIKREQTDLKKGSNSIKYLLLCGNQNQLVTVVRLRQIPVPKNIPGYLTLWVDPDVKQHNIKIYQQIMKELKLPNNDLIQFNSNEQFRQWLVEYQHIISVPDLKVKYITCMNRPPYFKNEGIQTYKMIREFNKYANITFYIGDVQKCITALKNGGIIPQPNLKVISSPEDLKKSFFNEFLVK